ncbi:MAG: T9SS type A sorting domain-containing protein [Ginsengibacter sp.]
MKKYILFCILAIYCVLVADAQPSLLDPAFGVNGIVATDLGSPFAYTNFGKQVLLQPDGSIYLVFESAGATLIAKKLPGGSPDVTYGNKGYSVAAPVVNAHAAIQTDGKIVIGGIVTNPDYYSNQYDFALARFNTDGSLDYTFDGDGIQVTNLGSADFINSIAIQSDNKIVVAGSTVFAPYFDVSYIKLARYNADGSLDDGFGTGGIVTTDIGDNQYASSVAIQSDGKIVIEGFIDVGYALLRYNSDGTPDLAFNGTGYKNIDFGAQSVNNTIVLQSDNKIIAGSTLFNGTNNDFAVARFNTDGTPDNTFDGDGIQVTDFAGAGDTLTSLALQSDGKIVASGYSSEGGNTNFAIARYNTNGTLDNSFDGDGKKTTDFGGSNDYASVLEIQSDGKIIAAGYTVNGSNTYLASARYNSDGTPDNSFDTDGMLVDHVNEGDTHYTCSVIQGDGKILAAGNTWNGTNYDFAVVRYNTDGSLDNTFSGDGKLTTGFGTTNDYANSIAIQNDGKIVVAGTAGDNFAVTRYNVDGTPDNTFDGDGSLTTDIGDHDFLNSVAIQNDGKILVGGSALARFNTNGSPDMSFNATGQLAISFTCNSIAIQSDGKIVACGTYGGDGLVARFNNDGSPDATFATAGLLDIFGEGEGSFWTLKSMAIQNDGKIVIGGSNGNSYRTSQVHFIVVRLTADGNLDNTFDSDGFAAAYPGPSNQDYGISMIIQPDNKIILAGSAYNRSNDNFAIVRFNTDGSLDNTFSGDGIEITKGSTAYNGIAGISFANDILYAVGYGQYPGNFGVIAKYLVPSGGPLPVALTDFTALLKNGSVLLQWQTASEHNLGRFIIERSIDGNRFSPIGDLNARGNSDIKVNYSTLDQQPVNGANFYRLKIVDADGNFKYSKIVEVNIPRLFSLSVYPNPATNILYIQASGTNEKSTFQIFDATGRKIKGGAFTLQENTSVPIDINTLSKGTYYLRLSGKSKAETTVFVKE